MLPRCTTVPPATAPRSGVTLLEVIVSMAVLVVGLMGMASLIPLGRLEMAEGDRLDNTSTLGRTAFRELTVRGYLNPQMWAHPLTGDPVANSFNPANPEPYIFSPLNRKMLPPYAPIVIDPLMCAPRFQQEEVNAAGLTQAEQDHRTNVQVFPYKIAGGGGDGWPESSVPRFARATLRTYPVKASRSVARSPAHTMRFDAASRIFRSSDDLDLHIPLDRTRKPVQVFTQSALVEGKSEVSAYDGVITENTVEQVAFRKYRGDYSWFFIVQPNQAELLPNGPASRESAYNVDSYRVWVVVCNKRDLRDTSTMNLDTDRVVGERCVWLDFIDRYTARLRVPGVSDEGTALRILDVKPHQWIACITSFPNSMINDTEYVIEWLRVVNAADRPAQNPEDGMWYREVTLAGRDMSSTGTSSLGQEFVPAQANYTYSDAGSISHNAWGVIIPGVRGVYEKTVYLDRTSLYTPQ